MVDIIIEAPSIATSRLLPSTFEVRDGAYGGPTVFFNPAGDRVVITSPLNEFMVSNLMFTPSDDGVRQGREEE